MKVTPISGLATAVRLQWGKIDLQIPYKPADLANPAKTNITQALGSKQRVGIY